MIRRYAQYSFNYPKMHLLNIAVLVMLIVISTYQLLANEQLVFALGLLFPVVPLAVLARASDYKRKYLHD